MLRFPDWTIFNAFGTDKNPNGLYACSQIKSDGKFCITTPYETQGMIRVQWFDSKFEEDFDL